MYNRLTHILTHINHQLVEIRPYGGVRDLPRQDRWPCECVCALSKLSARCSCRIIYFSVCINGESEMVRDHWEDKKTADKT